MDYQDQNVTCQDCNNEFVWSAREQEFYASKNLSAPRRCKDCRMKRKSGQGGYGNQPRQMYPITCSSCGKAGEVPFEPKHDNVLCKECYTAQKEQNN